MKKRSWMNSIAIDAWFLCIAPLERPQLAIAVIVEGGGYGSKSARRLLPRWS